MLTATTTKRVCLAFNGSARAFSINVSSKVKQKNVPALQRTHTTKMLESNSLLQQVDRLSRNSEDSTDAVLDMLRAFIKKHEDVRSLSSISSADEIRIGVTGRGLLVLDGNSFVVTTAEPHTLKVIEVVKRRWSLATECGCRILIDLLLLDAVNRCDPKLAVFPEYKISGTIGSLKLGGTLDYLVAPLDVAANLRVSALMRAAPSIPYLVVIEAKKESFLSGESQLLAEMKVLWSKLETKTKVFGALSSGVFWRFLVLDEDGEGYYEGRKSDHMDFHYEMDIAIILSYLVGFLQQQLPVGVSFCPSK